MLSLYNQLKEGITGYIMSTKINTDDARRSAGYRNPRNKITPGLRNYRSDQETNSRGRVNNIQDGMGGNCWGEVQLTQCVSKAKSEPYGVGDHSKFDPLKRRIATEQRGFQKGKTVQLVNFGNDVWKIVDQMLEDALGFPVTRGKWIRESDICEVEVKYKNQSAVLAVKVRTVDGESNEVSVVNKLDAEDLDKMLLADICTLSKYDSKLKKTIFVELSHYLESKPASDTDKFKLMKQSSDSGFYEDSDSENHVIKLPEGKEGKDYQDWAKNVKEIYGLNPKDSNQVKMDIEEICKNQLDVNTEKALDNSTFINIDPQGHIVKGNPARFVVFDAKFVNIDDVEEMTHHNVSVDELYKVYCNWFQFKDGF